MHVLCAKKVPYHAVSIIIQTNGMCESRSGTVFNQNIPVYGQSIYGKIVFDSASYTLIFTVVCPRTYSILSHIWIATAQNICFCQIAYAERTTWIRFPNNEACFPIAPPQDKPLSQSCSMRMVCYGNRMRNVSWKVKFFAVFLWEEIVTTYHQYASKEFHRCLIRDKLVDGRFGT